MSDTQCALTVVIASVDSKAAILECIESIRIATAGLDAELFVVDSSQDETASTAVSVLGESHVIRVPHGALVPELWARGIAASRGRTVALTIAQCRVSPEWAHALLDGIESCKGGVASAIELARDAKARDCAIFYLRYSEFLQYRGKQVIGINSIPADNAAYDGVAIRKYVSAVPGGFWEVDFHRAVSASLGPLGVVAAAQASFSRSPRLTSLLSHRFRHGSHSGAWRARVGARSRWVIVAGAPLVPFVVLLRVARRVAGDARHRVRFMSALGPFLLLASAWAVGEAWGAARQGSSASRIAA